MTIRKYLAINKFLALIGLCTALSCCASRPPHAMIVQSPSVNCTPALLKSHAPCLAPPQFDENGDLYQSWQPSQLTPLGCFLHKVITFGNVPLECKRPARKGGST